MREVSLRGERQLSFVWRYATRDVTKNHPLAQGVEQVLALLGPEFLHAHLHTRTHEIQLSFSRKGKASLRVGAQHAPQPAQDDATSDPPPAPAAAHDQAKHRPLALDKPFWTDLGVTHLVKGERVLVPAMSRKWKQINKFIEVLGAALKSSPSLPRPRSTSSTSARARVTSPSRCTTGWSAGQDRPGSPAWSCARTW